MRLHTPTTAEVRAHAYAETVFFRGRQAEAPPDPCDVVFVAATLIGAAMQAYRAARNVAGRAAGAAPIDSESDQAARVLLANGTLLEQAAAKILLVSAVTDGVLAEQYNGYRLGQALAAHHGDFITTASANLPALTCAAAHGAAEGLATLLDAAHRHGDPRDLDELCALVGCDHTDLRALLDARGDPWWDLSIAAARAFAAARAPWHRG